MLLLGLIPLCIYCFWVLGYEVQQSEFNSIGLHSGLLFIVYFLVVQWSDEQSLLFWILAAILFRFLIIWGMPLLSDDVFRFIWDGRLILAGINPFDHVPSFYMETGNELEILPLSLFEKLNSPEYFTIYPPIAQLTFVVSVWLFPTNILANAIVMKIFLFGFELGNLWLIWKLLQHFKLPKQNILLYALNPLIIVEICGNLHFEGAMIFFLLLSIWLIVNNKNIPSAIAYGGAIAAKLLPLMFLPFYIRRLGWKKSIIFFCTIGISLIVLFLPILGPAFFEGFSNSLDLYFRRFEFNGSIYYAGRWLGYQLEGQNMIKKIGPVLALCTLLSILLMALLEKKKGWLSLFEKMLFAITIYLAFTTTVHPWYVSLPIVTCLFTRFRYPIVWSALILMTYINYSYPEYYENLLVVGLEYSLLGAYMIYELFFKSDK